MQSKNTMPIYSPQTQNFKNGIANSSGMMTISNFSNGEYNQTGTKSSAFLK
jgi:hypothetical protein